MESNVVQLNTPNSRPTWIRARAFAEATGMTQRFVYMELAAGRLHGVQVNTSWFIRTGEIENYFERNGKRAAQAAA